MAKTKDASAKDASAEETTATKKKNEPTSYVVQRQFTAADLAQPESGPAVSLPPGLPEEIWYDVGTYTAQNAETAMKAAAAALVPGDEGVRAGAYRAFPARSDSRLTAATEVKTIALFSTPKATNASENGASPATTEE